MIINESSVNGKNDMDTSEDDPKLFPENIRQRHNLFREAFDRHMVHEDWPQLVAQDLGWTIDQVEEHAYRYLYVLSKCDTASQKADSNLPFDAPQWTLPEKAFLELSMAHQVDQTRHFHSPDERLAQYFPYRRLEGVVAEKRRVEGHGHQWATEFERQRLRQHQKVQNEKET